MKRLFFIFGGLVFGLIFCLANVSAQENVRKPSNIVKLKKGVPIDFPIPPYPDEAREKKVNGKVKVEVIIDEQGKVVSAKSVSGHRLLRASAEKAAMEAKFTPTLIGDLPSKAKATLIYKFIY